MRIFLTGHGTLPERLTWYRESIDRLAPKHRLVSSPGQADIVFCAESGSNKFRSFAKTLELDSAVTSHPDKVFIYDYGDHPVFFLSGLYSNMPRQRVDPVRTRPADTWSEIEPAAVAELLGRRGEPSLLFSFRGSNSATVRESLYALNTSGLEARITRTFRWWDYGEASEDKDRRVYLDELRDSLFVLCPRGLAPQSRRTYETMQLGRVPVILSDDWVPPDGVAWPDFSIRVAESRCAELPQILEDHRPDAAEMGRAARAAWDEKIKPGPVLMRRWLGAIQEIMETRPSGWSEAAQYRRWRSNRFLWDNGIHPAQSAAKRLLGRRRPGPTDLPAGSKISAGLGVSSQSYFHSARRSRPIC
ncbi:MAG: exostosin domain-containing protein [Acidimicrobiales bacterium]